MLPACLPRSAQQGKTSRHTGHCCRLHSSPVVHCAQGGGGGGSSVKAGTSVAATAGSEDVDFEYDDDIAGSDDEEAKMYEELQVRSL